MTNELQDSCGEIKSIIARTQGTPTQKLIAALCALGVDKTADLARIIGVKERAIQTAKRNTLRATYCVTQHIAPQPIAETQPVAGEAQCVAVARVEDTYFPFSLVDRPASEDSPFSVPPKPKQLPRGARLSNDWALPPDWGTWARVTFPQLTAERLQIEADTFRDFWTAKAGKDAAKLDWEATWRNWCRRSFATGPLRPHSQPPPSAKKRGLADVLREAMAS